MVDLQRARPKGPKVSARTVALACNEKELSYLRFSLGANYSKVVAVRSAVRAVSREAHDTPEAFCAG